MRIPAQGEVMVVPTIHKDDGLIIHVAASPFDENTITLELQYAEEHEHPHFKFKRFLMDRALAQLLADRLPILLALPADGAPQQAPVTLLSTSSLPKIEDEPS